MKGITLVKTTALVQNDVSASVIDCTEVVKAGIHTKESITKEIYTKEKEIFYKNLERLKQGKPLEEK